MRRSHILPLLLAGLLCSDALSAQAPAVSLLPRVGVFTQPRPFTMSFDMFGPEYRQVWEYRLGAAPVFGAALEVRAAGVPLPVRVEVNHAPSLALTHRAERFGPPVYEEASANVTTLTAAAVLESQRLCWSGVCPRLLVGAGAKHYRFDAELLWDDVRDRFADDQTRMSLQVGAGLQARFDRITLNLEANDFSNRVEYRHRDSPGGRVHDTLVTFGIGFGLR